MGRKRSLLGEHTSDDEDYWERFTDGLCLPELPTFDDYPDNAFDEYVMEKLPPVMTEKRCWNIFKACLGCPTIIRFEPEQTYGENFAHVLRTHNQLRKVHNAKPLHLDRKLCELAETITIDMAQKRVTDVAKALLPCESSQYSVTILFAQGKPTTTCMTGTQAVQKAYNTGAEYEYNDTFAKNYEPFFNLIWKKSKKLGMGRVTVVTHSYSEYRRCAKEKTQYQPVERTYVVFLYSPAASPLPEEIHKNVQRKAVQGVLKSSNASFASIVSGRSKRSVSIKEPDEKEPNPMFMLFKNEEIVKTEKKKRRRKSRVHPEKVKSSTRQKRRRREESGDTNGDRATSRESSQL